MSTAGGMIDWVCPINWMHPLNRGLTNAYLVLPGMGGSRMQDLTKRLDGTLTNMDSSNWVGEKHAGGFGSLEFTDSQQERVAIASPTITAFPCTMMMWLKNKSVTDQRLMQVSLNSDNDRYLLFHCTSTDWLYIVRNNGSPVTSTGGTPDTTDWHLLAGVTAATNDHMLYLDGVEIGTNTTAVTAAAYNVTTIGGENESAGSEYCDAYISDARFYHRALSATEVMQYYRESLAGYPNVLNRISRPRGFVPAAGGGPPGLMMLGNQFAGGMAG